MPINNSPTIRQRRLARRLRELRVAAGLTHADAALVLGSAESKIGRIENAQSGIRLPDLRALLDAYGVADPGGRSEMELLARESKQKGWWSPYADAVDSAYAAYIAVEWDASKLCSVETNIIPGLLQTPEYARALVRLQSPELTPAAVDARINLGQERRMVLTREHSLQLRVVISESALAHRVGGPEVMKPQLESLIMDSRRQNIELRVLPQDDPMNACLFGPFVIMSFPASSEADVIYAESPTSTLCFEEEGDVETYATLFRRINTAAANAGKSRDLIMGALKEMV